jgi:hypothetical protein
MKYRKIYYYDKDGIRQEFYAKDLDTKENIAALKEYEIWDDTESILLTPTDFVEHKTRKSFFRAKPNQPNKISGSEESEKHDLIVEKIYTELIDFIKLKIWYKDFIDNKPKDTTLIEVQSFNWNFEVTREINDFEKMARFDIYGACSKGTLSSKRPQIIIEVIDTHFFEKDLFVALREKSRNTSTLILLYFTENENLYNKIQNNELRITAYFKNGDFYYGGILIKELEPEIQDEIQNPYLYYNQINQNFIKKIRKGKKVDIYQLKKENVW